VRAEATATNDSNAGVIGIADGTIGLGVIGISNGIAPVAGNGNAAGVIGIATATSGKSFGISGQVSSPDGIAVQANSSNGAALFVGSNDASGNVFTVGSLGGVTGRAFSNQDQSFAADRFGNLHANAINVGADTFVVQPDGTTSAHSLFINGTTLTANGNSVGVNGSLTVTGTTGAAQVNATGVTVTGPISSTGNIQAGSLSVTNTATVNGLVANSTVQVHDLNILSLPGGGSVTLCINGINVSTCSSSLRYKKNILGFGAGLDVVSRLRPITFRWKEGGQPDLGLVAEEVNSIEPLLVTHNSKGEIEGVKYDRLSAIFINAFKEQQAQIEAQQKQIDQQKAEMATLKGLICGRHKRARVCSSK
jgi:hypothetical protein